MAIQILPTHSSASQLGRSLGSGLEALAEYKVNQLIQQQNERRTAGDLEAAGFSSAEAKVLAGLPPQQRAALLQSARPFEQQAMQEFGQSPQQIQQLTNGGLQQLAQQPQQSAQEASLPQLFQSLGLQYNPQTLEQSLFKGHPALQRQMRPAIATKLAPTSQQSAQQAQPAAVQQRLPASPEVIEPQKPTRSIFQAPEVGMTPAERKQAHAEQKAIDKETQKYYDTTLALNEGSMNADKRLNKMENLIKKGGLPVSTFYNLFKNLEEKINPTHTAAAGGGIGAFLGGPVGAAIGAGIGGLLGPVSTILRSAQKFTSPNTEQFEKLSTDFIRDAKNIFGNRLTDADLNAFLQSIPTLSQTDNGKLAIIKNMHSFNKALQVKAKTMKDIIKENGGRRPANLQILVEERAQPELDKLAQEFEAV